MKPSRRSRHRAPEPASPPPTRRKCHGIEESSWRVSRPRPIAKKKLLDIRRHCRNRLQGCTKCCRGTAAEGSSQPKHAISAFDESADNQTSRLTKELASSRTDLAVLKAGNPPEVIKVAQADIAKSEMLLASLKKEIARSEIRAPIDGTVATSFPEYMVGQKTRCGRRVHSTREYVKSRGGVVCSGKGDSRTLSRAASSG